MKLSIITINQNNADGLARTLESTFGAQPGFDDWEQIVVDGASTDGSFSVLDKWKDNPHLGWHVSEPDTGIYNAMNKGAVHARGDYLLFLNTGDTLLANALARVFSEPFDEDIVYGDIVISRSIEGRKLGPDIIWRVPDPEDVTPAYFLLTALPHQSCLISRRLHENKGGYDETLKVYSDCQFLLDCVASGTVRLRHLPFTFSRFTEGGISTRAQYEECFLSEREQMLASRFGRYAAHRVVYPPERRWLSARTAELAKRDAVFAGCLRRVVVIVDRLWRVRVFRNMVLGLRRIASVIKGHRTS